MIPLKINQDNKASDSPTTMVVTFVTVVELLKSRFKANKPVYMKTLKAMLSTCEFVCQSDGSVGHLFDAAPFEDIPINEQPLLLP